MAQDADDEFMALQLQAQFDEEAAYHRSLQDWTLLQETVDKPPVTHSMRRDLSIVDPFWELNDPIPDIHCLFREFDAAYFWSKLGCVEVKWSPRMTQCAGVCSCKGNGGLISVRLSEPLLKLRPRKDLIETLLHEMIHAYLFVTHNFHDRNAHGEEFLKHMRRINTATGANITVYHNFHDEVENYRVHWWRCTGPCCDRRPYYGMVKRAMNRPPSARDMWWDDHQRTCGGTFIKIREPEPKAKRKWTEKNNIATDSKKRKSGQQDFFDLLTSSQKIGGPPTEASQRSPLAKTSHHKPKVLANIHGFNGALHKPSQSKDQSMVPFSGKGHVLGSSSFPSHNGSSELAEGTAPRASVSVHSTRLKQPTLVDFFEGQNKKQATSPDHHGRQNGSQSSSSTVTSRRRSLNKMKFLYELLISESEDEDGAETGVSAPHDGAKTEEEIKASASTKSQDDDWPSMWQGVAWGGDSNALVSHYGSSKPVAVASIFRGRSVYDGNVPSTSGEKSWKNSSACPGTASASCFGNDDDEDIVMWIEDAPSRTGQCGDYKQQQLGSGNGLQQYKNKTATGLQGADHVAKSLGNSCGENGKDLDIEMLSQESLWGYDEPMVSQDSTQGGRQEGTTSLIVACPACGLKLEERLINQHLDLECVIEL